MKISSDSLKWTPNNQVLKLISSSLPCPGYLKPYPSPDFVVVALFTLCTKRERVTTPPLANVTTITHTLNFSLSLPHSDPSATFLSSIGPQSALVFRNKVIVFHELVLQIGAESKTSTCYLTLSGLKTSYSLFSPNDPN